MATFWCRCNEDLRCPHLIEVWTCCRTCSFLIYNDSVPCITTCPACNRTESWEVIGFPCLACQLASIIYCNPFKDRFQCHLEQWLTQNDSETSEYEFTTPTRSTNGKGLQNDRDMLHKRNCSIEQSFQEMKQKATPQETQYIFENLSMLQRSIQSSCSYLKQDHSLQHNTSLSKNSQANEQSVKRKSNIPWVLFQDRQCQLSISDSSYRSPLKNIDINSQYSSLNSKRGSDIGIHKLSKNDRTQKMKAKK